MTKKGEEEGNQADEEEEEDADGETEDEESESEQSGGEESGNDLAALRKQFQGKINVAMAKRAQKYIDIAEKQDDPEDALNFYWDGLALLDDLEREDSAQIDDATSQPAQIVTYGYVINPLKMEALTEAGFASMSTAALYDTLYTEKQKAVADWANLTSPVDVPDDQAVKDRFDNLVDIIEQVGICHYEFVRAGMYLHIELSRLYDANALLEFLASKGQVERQLVRYNAHSPHLALELEEQELNGVARLLALVARMQDYLMSADYNNAKRAAAIAKQPVAPLPTLSGVGTTGAGAVNKYTASINLVKQMPTRTENERKVFAIKLAKAGGTTKDDKQKGKQVLAVNAVNVSTENALFVPVSPVVIDMAETRNPLDILQDIATAMSALVEQGLTFIAQLKRLARSINFNIYTLKFGSTTPLADNRAMMQKLRKDVAGFILKDLKMSATQPPVLIIKHQIVTQEFATRYGAGPAVGAISLSPGEEMEDTSESEASSKRVTEQSDSIFDAKTTTVKDSLNKSRENVLSQTNTDTSELSTYLNKSQNVDTEESMSLGVSASVDLWDVVSVDVDYNWDKSTSVSTGVEQGSNSTATSTREQGKTNTESMVQDHVEESTANRERTQTTSDKQEEELSTKNKVVRKLKNINRASATTVILCKLIQTHRSVTTTPGFKIQYANGSILAECTVDRLKQEILDKYVREDAKDMRDAIWKLVKANAMVLDYQGRLVNLLYEAGGSERLLGTTTYFKLLRQQNLAEVAEDLPLKPFKGWIHGVVLSTRMYTMPLPAIVRRVVVSKPALDIYEKHFLENDVKKSDIEVGLLQNQLDTKDTFLDSYKKESNFDQKIKIGFLLLQPPGDIVQKGMLNYVAGLGGNGLDAADVARIKAYFKGMKVDV